MTLGPAYCAKIRERKLADINTDDVLAVLQPVWMEKNETASRLRGRIERVLDATKAKGQRKGRPLSGMAMEMLLRRQKLEITVHGFRSSFRDWAAEETSFPWEIAEAALSHVVGDATERAYRRGDALEKRRELMTAWAAHCQPVAVE